MHINVNTFEKLLNKRGMTQVALAERAKLGVKTVGRIKRGEELRPKNVEKIARALNTSVDVLQAPPTSDLAEGNKTYPGNTGLNRFVIDLDSNTLNNLSLASFHYRVPMKALIQYAPLLFSILAELNLKKRRERLEDWKAKAGEIVEDGPTYHGFEYRSLKDHLNDLYFEEASSINRRDLSGPYDGEYFTDPSYEPDSSADNLFLSFLEDLASEAGGYLEFFGSTIDDITYYNNDAFYDAKFNLIDPEADLAGKAEAAFTEGHVLLRDIPKDLLSEDRSAERVQWLASHYREPKGDIARAKEFSQEGWQAPSGEENATDEVSEDPENA